MDAFEELKRIIAPFSIEQIDHALSDRPLASNDDAFHALAMTPSTPSR